jgi:hypothetical protein
MSINLEARFRKFEQMSLQLIIEFEDPSVLVDLYASDVRYSDENVVRLLGVGEPADDRFLAEVLSKAELQGAVARISIYDQAELTIEFSGSGIALAALPNAEYEGWTARFDPPVADGVTTAVCGPGGRLATFGPPR